MVKKTQYSRASNCLRFSRKYALMCSLLMVLGSPAQAVEWAVDAHAGLLGAGIGGAIKLTRNINVRFGFNSLDLSDLVDEIEDDGGIQYSDPEIQLDNQYGLIDFHPLGGGFRLSAGVILNSNEVTAGAQIVDNQTDFGDVTGGLVGTRVDAKVDFDSVAPYVGIGWGNAIGRRGGLKVGLDLGLMLQGSPNVDINVSGAGADLNLIDQDDIDIEEREFEEEIEDADVWPVIQLSIGYHFK